MGAAHVTTQKLRFCDTDKLGHVNNAVYAVMLEAGRAELAAEAGFLDDGGPVAVVLARLELDFLREMTWTGEPVIDTAVVHFGTKSIRLRQRVTQDGRLVARAATVIAIMDTATRRAVPVGEEWRARFAPWFVADFE